MSEITLVIVAALPFALVAALGAYRISRDGARTQRPAKKHEQCR